MLVGLEGDLQNAVAESVAVEGLDGNHRLIVVGHGHEPEPWGRDYRPRLRKITLLGY